MTIKDIEHIKCTGCSLCSNVCPKGCISMRDDEEGFRYPSVDFSKCINCGLCFKKCPLNNNDVVSDCDQSYYGCINGNDVDLSKSSSGGVFIALAKYILNQGGYVCGCIVDYKAKRAIHICTNSLDDVYLMIGSKYVQSNIESVLPKIKRLIDSDNQVLFTGTPCQVAAVKNYIKDTANLILVDILCHGVPSPLFFEKYLRHLENKHKGELTKIEFRDKSRLGWGSCEHRTMYEIKKDSSSTKKTYHPFMPAYFCSFYWGTNLRESCYNCVFSKPERMSDITIGDFWGYRNYYNKENTTGFSIIKVNTLNGYRIVSEIREQMSFFEKLPINGIENANSGFYRSVSRPKCRESFYTGASKRTYANYIWPILLERETFKKLMISLYRRFAPKKLRQLYTALRY